MKSKAGGVAFPVVFYDGEHESNIGNITIHPSMDFEIFQSILSQMIGISPHQFTVHRVYHTDPSSPPESRRRIPITAKSKFAAISRERDCFFLVGLKRSRRHRRRPQPQQYVPNNVVLLRRNPDATTAQQLNGFGVSKYDDPVAMSEYERRFRENYLMMMMMEANSNWNNNGFFSDDEVVCEECRNATMKGTTAEFHCCLYDPVVEVFRTTAGAIGRPIENSGG